jgi:aminoethylphosphonate catabolism LysR family transcriptional regulator
MRYVQLRAFHYVAVCGGFSRAAEALSLTQPAISDQVRKLEESYDVLLFNRHKKQVTLTRIGEQLLEVTRRMFDIEQQALDLLSESRGLRSGNLRVVADSAHHLLPVLALFRSRHPGVHVSLRSGNSETVVASLYAYEADIGVLAEIPLGQDFTSVKLNSTPMIAFAAIGHPIANRGKTTLRELSGQPLVMRERGSQTRHLMERMAAAAGVDLRPAIEAEGREAVREIVASGGGIGFVSAAEFGQDARLVPISIEGPGVYMNEALICLRERRGSKLVKAFFETAQEGMALRQDTAEILPQR